MWGVDRAIGLFGFLQEPVEGWGDAGEVGSANGEQVVLPLVAEQVGVAAYVVDFSPQK